MHRLLLEGNSKLLWYNRGRPGEPQCAWYYPEPQEAAGQIRGYVAFWRGVKIA
jgi:uncharacterized protein (DUF427 family)